MLLSFLEREKAGGGTDLMVEMSSLLNTLHLRSYGECVCMEFSVDWWLWVLLGNGERQTPVDLFLLYL